MHVPVGIGLLSVHRWQIEDPVLMLSERARDGIELAPDGELLLGWPIVLPEQCLRCIFLVQPAYRPGAAVLRKRSRCKTLQRDQHDMPELHPRSRDRNVRAAFPRRSTFAPALRFHSACVARSARRVYVNAWIPVCARPRISAWMSCVPS